MKLAEAMQRALIGLESEIEDIWQSFPGRTVRGRRHQALFHAGDPSDAVYLMLDGEARAYLDGRTGSRTTLLLRAPALIGDRDILAEQPACENVELLSPARMLLWSDSEFLAEWGADERVRSWLFRDIATRYACSLVFSELAALSAETRVHAVLESLLPTHPSVTHLARACGVAEKTASRALARFDPASAILAERRLWHSLVGE